MKNKKNTPKLPKKEYKAYRRKQRRLFSCYIAIHLLLLFLFLRNMTSSADSTVLAEVLLTAAAVIIPIGVFLSFRRVEILPGVVIGKKPDQGTERMKYTVETPGHGTLFCFGLDETEFAQGEEVYIIDRIVIMKCEALSRSES